ncbi:MAG TPA: Crp/Fnr family transcriptional regulator [Casimicrobiaceae bacterium]|nr:Crp/Fnr family transcriptional regulator [Casimicrobiaceae bacterium]
MKARIDRPRADGHLDVLASIPSEYRAAVIEQCDRRTARKGQTIWSQGDPAAFIAFLIKGKAMSMYQSRGGKVGTTGFWCSGDILGAGDLGVKTTRQMTVRCLEPCVLYTLPYARFDPLIDRFPELARAVIQALSIRLRWVSRLAVMLETESGYERVCAVLIALAERFALPCADGMLIDLKLTHEDLASMSGVSRQYANVTLGDLRKRGYVRMEKRSIILTDYRKFRALLPAFDA